MFPLDENSPSVHVYVGVVWLDLERALEVGVRFLEQLLITQRLQI